MDTARCWLGVGVREGSPGKPPVLEGAGEADTIPGWRFQGGSGLRWNKPGLGVSGLEVWRSEGGEGEQDPHKTHQETFPHWKWTQN